MTSSDKEKGNENENGYIVEYVVIGNSVKVTAFDPITLREVSVIGAANMQRKQLGKLAVRKLIYMIKKNNGDQDVS